MNKYVEKSLYDILDKLDNWGDVSPHLSPYEDNEAVSENDRQRKTTVRQNNILDRLKFTV